MTRIRLRTRNRKRKEVEKPPRQFPAKIGPHVYTESGLGTCLTCGKSVYDTHIRRHRFEVNLSSTLRRCMCGYNKEHPIHGAN